MDVVNTCKLRAEEAGSTSDCLRGYANEKEVAEYKFPLALQKKKEEKKEPIISLALLVCAMRVCVGEMDDELL